MTSGNYLCQLSGVLTTSQCFKTKKMNKEKETSTTPSSHFGLSPQAIARIQKGIEEGSKRLDQEKRRVAAQAREAGSKPKYIN